MTLQTIDDDAGLDVRSLDELQTAFAQASIVLHKDYLSILEDNEQAEVAIPPQEIVQQKISTTSRFYRIDKLTYSGEENILDKLATVFSADYYYGGTLALVIQNNGKEIQYYLGVINKDGKDVATNGDILQTALQGNFPGTDMARLKNSEVEALFEQSFTKEHCRCVSAISGVASDKTEDLQENAKFVQGLEKLIDATRGQTYTLLVLADPLNKQQMQVVRSGYERLYSQLAPFAKTELTFNSTDSLTLTTGTNSSLSKAVNHSVSDAINRSVSDAISHSVTQTTSESESINESRSESTSHTMNKKGSGQKAGGALAAVGGAALGLVGIAAIGATGGAALPVVAAAAGATALGGIMSAFGESTSDGTTLSASSSTTMGSSTSDGTTAGRSATTSSGSSKTTTSGSTETNTTGRSDSEASGRSRGQTLQISSENRSVKYLLERIDDQLERLEQCENFGVFNCAAYVISNNASTNHSVASTYSALMRGEESGLETSAVNTWYEEDSNRQIGQYLSKGYHPEFYLRGMLFDTHSMRITPASVVSGRELAIHIGLPKKSVPGLPVVEMAEFGRNVYSQGEDSGKTLDLGNIYHMGHAEEASVRLDMQSMAMHTFITGSTGTGKSNTVYQLLSELERKGAGFLVIEPAKGEYKHMFGNRQDINVFGTNPYYMPLLKINPFKFPKGIHVLEHVDRLVEIFNVCWPMYAAMPAVLKDAVLRAYEACGWNLIDSINNDGELFPSFADVLQELDYVIEHSAYSADTKSDYIGSLATRLNSLANGLNGQIFVTDEIDSQILFDGKTIVDLSRVGSLETKSLIMGVLVMRLSEYRMTDAKGMNQPLRHVTVLEEAHNILKRTSTEQSMEGANIAGKSVEMIANAIAEMRTYGEGFIIADQSPNAIDISAIRNTNTKIIMRLPDEDDRQLAGRSAALRDEQLDEIAKLPKGIAVVYQNDWLEPVLCQIHRYHGQESPYRYIAPPIDSSAAEREKWFKQELLKLLVKGRVNEPIDVNIDKLQAQVLLMNLATKTKRLLKELFNSYQATGKLDLWKDEQFANLSAVVVDILQCRETVKQAVLEANDYDELNRSLQRIVYQEYESASQETCLTLCQCMMKQFSLEKNAPIETYAAWRENIRKKGEL